MIQWMIAKQPTTASASKSGPTPWLLLRCFFMAEFVKGDGARAKRVNGSDGFAEKPRVGKVIAVTTPVVVALGGDVDVGFVANTTADFEI